MCFLSAFVLCICACMFRNIILKSDFIVFCSTFSFSAQLLERNGATALGPTNRIRCDRTWRNTLTDHFLLSQFHIYTTSDSLIYVETGCASFYLLFSGLHLILPWLRFCQTLMSLSDSVKHEPSEDICQNLDGYFCSALVCL